MISKNQDSSKGTWTRSFLKELDQGVSSCPTVLMDDFMIVMVHDTSEPKSSKNSVNDQEPATILAVDLRDNSVKAHDMDDFYYHKKYSFTKYNKNQIIKFGGVRDGAMLNDIFRITIRSFRPFHIVCEEIETNDDDDDSKEDENRSDNEDKGEKTREKPALSRHTAQIYKDSLYVFGGRNRSGLQSDLWKFNLKSSTWKLCKPKGQGPGPREKAKSFISQDNIYIYGGKGEGNYDSSINDIFVIDLSKRYVDLQRKGVYLESHNWNRIQQQTSIGKQIDLSETKTAGNLYKGNLLVLGGQDNQLWSWNMEDNIWSIFDIELTGLSRPHSSLVVYQNFLIVNGETQKGLSMAILDLNNIALSVEETPEQRHQKLLYMSKQESDMMFKVKEKIIPAHKRVLTEKSKFFASLFKSGMVESRQPIIDMHDCEFHVFQEYLRYLYRKEVKLDIEMAIKLFKFSDKYLQDDLNDKCMNFLKHNLNLENVFAVLDFARQENISHLVHSCIKFFDSNINIDNVANLIQYLDKSPEPEFEAEYLELKKFAFEIVYNNFIAASQKQKEKLEFYEEFLASNIQMATFKSLANFVCDERYVRLGIRSLQKHVFEFAHQNFEILQQKNIFQDIEKNFFIDLVSYGISKQKNSRINIEDGSESDAQPKKGLKRREPSHNKGTSEENPALKQTKKDSAC